MRNVLCVLLFIMFGAATTWSQSTDTPLTIIRTEKQYRATIAHDPAKQMTDIATAIPGLKFDLRYAGTNNFTHTILYHNARPFLRQKAATALYAVQADLLKLGMGLLIFDAYRPYSVSCTMWHVAPDRHYVANPRKGSNHNRGLAVDATLINLNTGTPVDMGTGFDNFTDSAHHSFLRLPASVIANRKLLRNTMRRHGFGMVPSEWWHYQYHNDDGYEVLDLPFNALN